MTPAVGALGWTTCNGLISFLAGMDDTRWVILRVERDNAVTLFCAI